MKSMFFFLFISVLAMTIGAENHKEVRICDSTSNQNAPAIYTEYIRSLYSQGFSTTPLSMPNNCNEFEAGNTMIFGWLNFISYNINQQKVINMDIGGRLAECAKIYQNIENSEKGIGLSVNWPISYLIQTLLNTNGISNEIYKQYTEQTLSLKYNTYDSTQLHSFVTKSDKSTVWTSVTFERPQGYDTELPPWCTYDWTKAIPFGSKACLHPFYRLADSMFNRPYTFSSTGIEEVKGYITFNKALYAGISRKIVQVRATDGSLAWGVLMPGCSPPVFDLRLVWGRNDIKQCSRPEIIVTNIRAAENFVCSMDFSTNTLRNQVLPGATAAEMQKNSEAILIRKIFAKKKDVSTQVILISSSHAKTISRCIFSEQIPMKWDMWSETAPGKCITCSSSGSFISKTPRACNRELSTEKFKDCCFDCARGYNMLAYYDSFKKTEETQCVKACARGYAYDNERSEFPKCVQCGPGKYNKNSGLGGCLNCAALGLQNAVVISAKSGCVWCGNRATASIEGTTCIPCGPREYVPENEAFCTTCPVGSRLISVESRVCTPCSPGYEYSRSGTCILCPINTFKANSGSGKCMPCPYATRALPNRTLCVPCNTLDKGLAPLAIYKRNTTCEVVCNLSVSYAYNNNPYTAEGCKPCSEKPPPIGTYSDPADCSSFLPCTNAPASILSLIEYTGTGPICPWRCKSGFKKSADLSLCVPCNSIGFNEAIHVYTQECLYSCIPKLYYRGAGLACNQRCTNLLDADSLIFRRLGDYYRFYLNGSKVPVRTLWPNYIMGQCGSAETDPTSSLPLLKYVGIYGFYVVGGGTCGNFILNTNEECDDGNSANGDGCSSACQIERNDFWDCDVIGEPCKKLCGWSEVARDSWGVGLAGFALDPRPAINKGLPWCTGILYYQDFLLPVPLEFRSAWMQKNLVSCECESNPLQVLPYKECNYTNGGCRQCDHGTYRDDLYARCSPCGSACALGFRSYNKTKDSLLNDINAGIRSKYGFSKGSLDQCGPHIATSQNVSFADPVDNPYLFGREQILIGCVPCSTDYNPVENLVFMPDENGRACNWICKRDPANQSDVDYYCESSNAKVCNGKCSSCDEKLKIVNQSIIIHHVGKYITSCADLIGHSIDNCDPPPSSNAYFTGNSVRVVGDRAGCPWACEKGYQKLQDKCVFCNASRPLCDRGEMVVPCTHQTGFHCASCVLVKGVEGLSPMEIWHSLPDYSDCVPGCEVGVSFKNISNPSEKCQPCTQPECELNELFVQCTAGEDSTCTPCTSITDDELVSNHREFYSSGTCKTRCSAGYASDNDGFYCTLCSSIACVAGHRLEHNCISPFERNALPRCIPCDVDIPMTGRKWDIVAGGCATSCLDGWMFASAENKTCIPCQYTLCNEGYGANCVNGRLNCYACPLSMEIMALNHQKYAGPGNCSTLCESASYRRVHKHNGEIHCEKEIVVSEQIGNIPRSVNDERGVNLLALIMDRGGNNSTSNTQKTAPYPRRNIPHSSQN